jgi:ATP-dependent Clp protease ATP-binding subunit ClpA
MKKEFKNKFIVYSHTLDRFIPIQKLDEEDLEKLVLSVLDEVVTPNYSITEYVDFLVERLVIGYDSVKKTCTADAPAGDDPYGSVEGALFECVIEIYRGFSLDMINGTINSYLDEKGRGIAPDTKKALTFSDFSSIEERMKKAIVGQDAAIEEVMRQLRLMKSGLCANSNLFFIGPTGVGKTELSKEISRQIFGSQKKLMKINCGEYSNAHEYAKLIGSPPGYIGHNEKGILAEKAEKSDEWVIVFDEIEKAHDKLFDLLLNLMDEGTITDSHGTELDFKKSLIIFTSNVGLKEVSNKTSLGFGDIRYTYENSKDDVNKAFKDRFSPEFRNRLDAVVFFNQLNKSDAEKIVQLQLKKLPIRITKKLVSFVVGESFSEEYGARNVNRFIKNNITIKIADEILRGSDCAKYKAVFKGASFVGVEPC